MRLLLPVSSATTSRLLWTILVLLTSSSNSSRHGFLVLAMPSCGPSCNTKVRVPVQQQQGWRIDPHQLDKSRTSPTKNLLETFQPSSSSSSSPGSRNRHLDDEGQLMDHEGQPSHNITTQTAGLVQNDQGQVLMEFYGNNTNNALCQDLMQQCNATVVIASELQCNVYVHPDTVTVCDNVASVHHSLPVVAEQRQFTGPVVNEANQALEVDPVHDTLGITGANVKVCVISGSFNALDGYDLDVSEGELPPDVQIVRDLTGLNSNAGDEGRALLQLIHDIAPRASLAFRTGLQSALDMASGIVVLANLGCDIIMDDIGTLTDVSKIAHAFTGWRDCALTTLLSHLHFSFLHPLTVYCAEPFFGDGTIAQAANSVVETMGVAYFSAAGNQARTSYESSFVSSGNDFNTGGYCDIHLFGGTDLA